MDTSSCNPNSEAAEPPPHHDTAPQAAKEMSEGRRLTQPQRDYEVGYGKPPEHSRFKKGQSGNPSGRPKGSKNLATVLNEVLSERVTLTENGKPRRLAKRVMLMKQLVNRAVKSDTAMRMLLRLTSEIDGRSELSTQPTPVKIVISGDDARLL